MDSDDPSGPDQLPRTVAVSLRALVTELLRAGLISPAEVFGLIDEVREAMGE